MKGSKLIFSISLAVVFCLVLASHVAFAAEPVPPVGDRATYSYHLNPGWQLIGISLDLDDASKEMILKKGVYLYDMQWGNYARAEDIKVGGAVWIHSDVETELSVTGTIPSSQINELLRYEIENLKFGEVTYVIGHMSPDTDTVTSAILCADIYQKLGKNVQPRVSGKLNSETKYVLEHFGVPVPDTLTDATGQTMILVDHSSFGQAIPGMDKAKIIALFDHHGLGNVITAAPLMIKDKAVGCTATILYTVYLEYGIEITKQSAGLIVSAILSDTTNLTAEITTDLDRQAVSRLQSVAGIEDIEAYNNELVKASASYEDMTDSEIFISDYKDFPYKETNFGIGCVNAWGEEATEAMATRMLAIMNDPATKTLLNEKFGTKERIHLYALLKDCQNNKSRLVYSEGAEPVVRAGYNDEFVNGGCHFDHVAARKLDVVPPLTSGYQQVYP